MSNKCKKCNYVNIEKTNKYIFLILLEALVYWASDAIEDQSKFFAEENLHPIIYNISISFGYSLSFILFIIFRIRNKRKNKKTKYMHNRQNNINKISWIKKFLWILLVSIIYFIAMTSESIYWINGNNYINLWTVYIIFLSLFSYLILKKKLYKHHYVSIIIIAIIGFLYNIIYNKFSFENLKNNYIYYLTSNLNLILYCLIYVLNKYYMLYKYMKSYEILFIQGLIILVLSIITLIMTTKIGRIDNFWDYYENLDKTEIIIFISLSLIYFISGILTLIIIDIFSPFYLLLADNAQDIMFFFYSLNELDLLIILCYIVFLVISMFMVLVFIELIELNFLGLSKMTKRNIELRAKLECMEAIEYDVNDFSDCDDKSDTIVEGYIIHDENGVELNNEKITDGKTICNE